MLKIIQNNPYRFLGVYSNAPTAERLANSRKLNAFLKVNKEVSFPLDLTHLMQPLARTVEGMNTANNSINLPKDQLKYALFWFINGGKIDEIALDHLKNGNTEKATELLEKKESFSSLINQGVLSFINGDNGNAIQCITKIIHDDDYLSCLINSICGSTFQISEEEVAQLFIETLLTEINVSQLKDLFEQFGTSSDDDEYLSKKAIGEPIAAINSAIAQAKNIKNVDTAGQYQAGISLMNSTKADLQAVRSILGTSNMQYQMVADNLAKQILQCGINYYNNSDEDEDEEIEKAYTLQNYALSIAVGKLTKDRCKENVEILKKKKNELPPKEARYYDKKIKDALAVYMTQPDKISYAIDLIKKVVPYLMSIKEVLGSTNTYYLRMSTLIVNASLHNIIEEFNSVMNDEIQIQMIIDRDGTIRRVKNVFEQAWKATLYMDKLDMEPDFKRGRYNQNRSSLKGQVEQLVNTYQSVTLDMRGETKIFNDCRTVADYNNYTKVFPGGKYVSQVKGKIEKMEFDACKTTQDCQRFKNKYPNTKFAINDKWEECYFKQCRSVSQYQAYLRDYPNGKYVSQAKTCIEQLSYDACRTIADYQSFLRSYPSGRYATAAKDKIEKLTYDQCRSVNDYKRYMSNYPRGKYYSAAKLFVDDEEMWSRCISSDSKDMYKDYLAKFPNGRHKTEAEQKASACYIATMVYGDYNHPQVVALRGFRDNTLRNSVLGRAFIRFYYQNSPAWVEKMQGKKTINSIIRTILDKFINIYNHESK